MDKVVAWHQYIRECGMIRIDAGINHCDEVIASRELLLRWGELNQRRPVLLNVAGADRASEIVDCVAGEQIGS